jgi:iron(III) transport system substrate-binding protein
MRLLAMAVITAGLLLTIGCGTGKEPASGKTVVVYVSEDQVFSEPVLKEFEKTSGISVQAVFDTEEAKSTGVMNRLIAESQNPQADVYWANEPIRAELLMQKGISIPYVSPQAAGIPLRFKDPLGHWTGFSARARLLVVRKDLKEKPKSVLAYTDPLFKGRGVIANPLFGTTTAQIAALFSIWGEARGRDFLDAMRRNETKISTSNGESADFVASGEASFSLVDSDDGFNRLKQGKPIEIIFPDQDPGGMGCMIIPNALLQVRGGPHPENARKLIDFLLSPESERMLAFSDAAQIPLHSGVETPAGVPHIESLKTMDLKVADVARKMQELQPLLESWVRK